MNNSEELCKGIRTLVDSHLKDILSLRNTGRLKKDNTFVSNGDMLCQRLIVDYIRGNMTNCCIISEELENDIKNLNDFEYVITIDPIDGTENFISGLKEWGIGVSVYKHMKHDYSMILLPELGECLCTGNKIERLSLSRICGLSSYMSSADFENLNDEFEYRIMGCCMYNIYNVIKGSYRQFLHMKGCFSWDILPGFNLALEHGLQVEINGKMYTGEFLFPNVRYKFVIKG